jgi:heme A synthase
VAVPNWSSRIGPPQYRIEGPETFHRFGDAAQAAAFGVGVVGLLFFLRNRRTGWPWLLAAAFFFLNGTLQMIVARSESTKALTALVASISRAPAFVLGLLIFAALLWMAWRAEPSRRTNPEPAYR